MYRLFLKVKAESGEIEQSFSSLHKVHKHILTIDTSTVEYILLERGNETIGESIDELVAYCEFWDGLE